MSLLPKLVERHNTYKIYKFIKQNFEVLHLSIRNEEGLSTQENEAHHDIMGFVFNLLVLNIRVVHRFCFTPLQRDSESDSPHTNGLIPLREKGEGFFI